MIWLLLAALVFLGAGAVCAAHIPGLREWTGAPPLDETERHGGDS